MDSPGSTSRFLPWLAAGIALVAMVVAGAALIAAQAEPAEVISPTLPPPPTATPVPNGAMWSIGTGGDDVNPYIEWVAVYPVSSLWNILGAPSIRFTDHAPDTPGQNRSFEIGFYKYGPTWYTRNPIVEFWVGGPDHGGGTLSIAGNDNTGGQLEVRNPGDTDHVALDFRNVERPTLLAGPSAPLHIQAERGIISDSTQSFAAGFDVPPESQHAGRVSGGAWNAGSLTVASSAVTAGSLVLITPISEPRGRWWVGDLLPGEAFVVHSSAANEDMAFNWLIVN